MSAPLSAEEKAEYTRIIDGILSSADLETVTRKKVRQGLEDTIGKDLGEQKSAIKSLIEARFDAISGESPTVLTPADTGADPDDADVDVKLENGHASSSGEPEPDADGEIEVSLPPAKKKQKRESSAEDADAKLAAQLQAQENRLARGRTTRGGANGKVTKVTKKTKSKPAKKKSAKRVRDDDSDLGSDSNAPKETKRKAGGGFQKPFNLSYPLAELCGESQVVKKLWEHIKGNELQDPTDKRQIICDEKMHAVFKQARVDMFQMNKLLGNQLYPIDE